MQSPSFQVTSVQQALKVVKVFFLLLLRHCKQDKITVSAGHLAYVSLLSLVPFIMVVFTFLSAFPAFAQIRADVAKDMEI